MPRHPDPLTGTMVAGLPSSIRRVPYRLPEVTADPDRDVLWVEGERDADRLAEAGLLATTTVSGARSYRKHAAEYAEHFRGRNFVAVLPDNDGDGRAYAEEVAASLDAVGAGVRIVELPNLPPKGDVSDWLDSGHSVTELRELVASAPRWQRLATRSGVCVGEAERPVGVLLSEVVPERVEWLWPGRIALGKLTLVDGDPGNGKSALTLDIAARVTTGAAWPDGSSCPLAGGVVLLTAEDGLADTVKPRLDAVGADTTRVVALRLVGTGKAERLPSIPADLSEVERAVCRVGAVLLIVDPLMAYLGSDVSSHKDQDVRRALAPLAAMAERQAMAVVVVRHLNKSNAGPAMYRGGGSIGIIGAARIGLLVGRDQADDSRLVLAATKANLGPKPPSLAYRLEEADNGSVRLAWEPGECSVSASDLLAGGIDEDNTRTAVDDAVEFLADELERPRQATDVKREARKAGIAQMTLKRAKAQLGVKSRREGYGGPWVWELSAHRGSWNAVGDHSQEVSPYGKGDPLWGGTERPTPGEADVRPRPSASVEVLDL